MIRATTNGVLKGYRADLMNSFTTLNKARDTVLTQRNFNSYAEDPSAAAQSYQLRRSFQRTDAQISVSSATIRRYETAYSAMESVVNLVDNEKATSAWSTVLTSMNSPTGSGRTALGTQLQQLSENIVQTMNSKYGDTFIFAGADGLDVPFEWDANGELLYRGINVDTGDKAQLDYLNSEERYLDIGIGLKEHNGELIESSAFNSSLSGIYFIGYGTDDQGYQNNMASIVKEMGEILSRCNESTGQWASDADQERFAGLAKKFEESAAELKKAHVELSARASFLKDNHKQLEAQAYNINEQILEIDQVDLADAITSFSWAQYCYNAALKVGNSILSESLMDYLR